LGFLGFFLGGDRRKRLREQLNLHYLIHCDA
jgi:hypothetical protein